MALGMSCAQASGGAAPGSIMTMLLARSTSWGPGALRGHAQGVAAQHALRSASPEHPQNTLEPPDAPAVTLTFLNITAQCRDRPACLLMTDGGSHDDNVTAVTLAQQRASSHPPVGAGLQGARGPLLLRSSQAGSTFSIMARAARRRRAAARRAALPASQPAKKESRLKLGSSGMRESSAWFMPMPCPCASACCSAGGSPCGMPCIPCTTVRTLSAV